MKKTIFIVILLVLSSNICLAAAETTIKEVYIPDTGEKYIIENSPLFENLEKPVVAVALGGGGARGFVNIGVLKALVEENIPIDMITGTSMGSVIAAMYGSGLPLAEIEKIITPGLMVSQVDLNIPFTKSLLSTRKLDYIIQKASPVERLEDFSVPTALLSLDLATGASVIQTTGEIQEAVISSYAIPLIFPVTAREGTYLIDPGVLELIPARTARLLGADIVISVTAFDELPYDTYELPFRAWIKMINIVKEQNSRKIVEDNSDYILEFEVGDYSYLDFALVQEFIALGYEQTKDNIAAIKKMLQDNQIPTRTYDSSNYYDNNAGKVDEIIADVKNNRVVYDFAEFKPVISYGSDHFLFNRGYFRKKLPEFQYGFRLGKKNIELIARLERGRDRYEISSRYKKLTPDLDLQFIYNRANEQDRFDLMILKYGDNHITGGGMSRIDNDNYLHLSNKYNISVDKLWFKGNIVLFSSFSSGINIIDEKIWENELIFPLMTGLDLNLRTVAAEVDRLDVPPIFRGRPGLIPGNFQGAVEVRKKYNFTHSINIMEFFQLSGLDFYTFLDYTNTADENYAPGIGLEMDINVFGVKPVTMGGYISRDFKNEINQGLLEFNLSF